MLGFSIAAWELAPRDRFIGWTPKHRDKNLPSGSTSSMSETHECDVAVIGSGAAGLSAALTARTHGVDVVVIEKSAHLGGTSAMSGGNVWVPCHHHQAGIGVEDSREEALEYIRAASPPGWHNTEDAMWVAFVDHAPLMLRFLEQHSPLRFVPNGEPDPYAELPGGKRSGRNISAAPLSVRMLGEWSSRLRACAPTLRYRLRYEELVDTSFIAHPRKWMLRFGPKLAWRLIAGQQTMGGALVVGLLKGCLEAGCTIWNRSPAQSLIRYGTRIGGVEVDRGAGSVKLLARKGVVLASGGFEWNAELMAEHFPGPVEWTGSPVTNTGDGHRMASAVGARLDHMDQALVIGTMPYRYEGRIQGTPSGDFMLPHSMIVNRHARRFVNEKTMNIGLAFEERDAGTGLPLHLPAWRIYDGQFARKYPHALPPRRFAGIRYKDRTLEGLARKIDLDPADLIASARRFSEFARTGVDLDFGRGSSLWDREHLVDPDHGPNPTLGTIEQPPFYAMPFKPSFLGTKGGPRTNERGQVLDEEGMVIPGLYAAGNVMANPFGSKGVGAGTTLGPCLTWGHICGLNIAGEP